MQSGRARERGRKTNSATLGRMRGALVRRLLVAALVLVAEFAAFEWFLRWRGGSEAAPVFQQLFMPDDVIGYRLRPGQSVVYTTPEFSTAISTNAQGVRDADIGPKPPGERRVVVLGDSLVLAVQVPREATFCARLEARLNASAPAGVRYRVINAGVQGYGPVEELLFYRRVASRFDADLVLVATFVANDAVEAVDAAWRLDGSRPPAVAVADETERTLRRVVRRSMVLQIARQRVDQVRVRAGATGAPSRPVASYLVTPPPFITDGLGVAARALGVVVAGGPGGWRPPGDRADAGALPARSRRVRAAARRHRADGRPDREGRRDRALQRRAGAARRAHHRSAAGAADRRRTASSSPGPCTSRPPATRRWPPRSRRSSAASTSSIRAAGS